MSDNNSRSHSIWQNRDYRLWFFGDTVSGIGSGIQGLAWTLLVFGITKDFIAASTIGAVRTATQLVTLLPGGIVSDSYDRKKLMILGALIEVISFSILCILIWINFLNMPIFIAFAIVQGLAAGAFDPVRHTTLPAIVDKQDLIVQ